MLAKVNEVVLVGALLSGASVKNAILFGTVALLKFEAYSENVVGHKKHRIYRMHH